MTTETETAATPLAAKGVQPKPSRVKAKAAKPTLKADALGTMRPAKPAANGLPKSGDRSAAKPASKPASARKATAAATMSHTWDKPLTARQQAEAAIAGGQVPNPPNFEAATHRRFLKAHAELVALVERGDIKRLRAWSINAVSSSPKALMKYRDRAIVALTARAKVAKA